MSKKKSTFKKRNIYFTISIIISVFGLVSGLILVRTGQEIRRSAQVTGPILYFTPLEITVPVNSTAQTYDIYLDTAGYEVNGAIFEVNFDPTTIKITNILEGNILTQVISHSVSGGTAYLTVVSADETKPFTGEGIVARVEFDTFGQSTTTTLVFGKNTQIHTKTATGGLPDNTPPGYINITPEILLTPTPTAEPSPTTIPAPTTEPTPTPTPAPSPTFTGDFPVISILPSKAYTQVGSNIPVSIFINSVKENISEMSVLLYYPQEGELAINNINNLTVNPIFSNSPDWDCTTQQPFSEGSYIYFGASCRLVNTIDYSIPTEVMFFMLDIEALKITYINPLYLKIDSSRSFIKDTLGNEILTNLTTWGTYYFCGTDANNDGFTNGNDFTVWLRNFDPVNTVFGGPASGDFNCDEYINGNDFTLWRRNFSPN